jgi:transcriptional regulator with XRE-family HTH domain
MNEFSTLRQKAGLTIADTAEVVGFSQSTVYRWDRGDQKPRRAAVELLRARLLSVRSAQPSPGFRFIDLFARIGVEITDGVSVGVRGSGNLQVFQPQVNDLGRLHRQWLSDLDSFKNTLRAQDAEPKSLEYVNEAFECLAKRTPSTTVSLSVG